MQLPARYFWKDVLERSFKETLVESLGFRSVEQVVIKGIYAVGILGALLWGGSPDAGWDQFVQYLGALSMVPFIFVLIWTWNFIRLPAKDSDGKDFKIAELQSSLQSDARRLAIKNRLGRAIREGKELLQLAGKQSFNPQALEDKSDNWYAETIEFIDRSLGEGESQILQSGFGITIHGTAQPNQKLRSGIETRLQRLVQLMQRADSVLIKPTYEVTDDDAR